MGINEFLFNELQPFLHYGAASSDYEIDVPDAKQFLLENTNDFNKRQGKAKEIVEQVMMNHDKGSLFFYVSELARIEQGIQQLEPWARDHVVHAVLTFLLGIYVNEKFLKPTFNRHVSTFQWQISGLLHDVGYPVQIANDLFQPFNEKVNDIKSRLGNLVRVNFVIVPRGLSQLSNGISGLSLIQKQLDEWGLSIQAKDEYGRMMEDGPICHGMISSLAVLNVIDAMYQKYNPERNYNTRYNGVMNWNQKYFKEDIVPACAAIFIHNLPERCFQSNKIDPIKAPLAYLLKLSDCLQDWERPSKDNPGGFSAGQYEMEIIEGKLAFRARLPSKNRDKLVEEINSYLVRTNLSIE